MTRIQFRHTAEPASGYPTRFALNAWDGQIGKVVPIRIGVRTDVLATLVAAEVVEDGAAVLLTLDVDESSEILAMLRGQNIADLYSQRLVSEPSLALVFEAVPARPDTGDGQSS